MASIEDTKIFVSGPPFEEGLGIDYYSVPIYWTGEEEDGQKEYKTPFRCCCFDIVFESVNAGGGVVIGSYYNNMGPFVGLVSGWLNDFNIKTFYRTVSGSRSYYSARTYSGTCACPPFTEPEDRITDLSGSVTYTVSEITQEFETRFTVENPNYPELCYTGTDECVYVYNLYGTVNSDTSVAFSSNSTSSFTNESNCGGSCTVTDTYNYQQSRVLSDPIPQSYLVNKAKENFINNTGNGYLTSYRDYFESGFGGASVSFINYYAQIIRLNGAKKYRLKFRKPPACYLKVWLLQTTKKFNNLSAFDAYEKSEIVIPKVLSFSQTLDSSTVEKDYTKCLTFEEYRSLVDSGSLGDRYETSEEFEMPIPPILEATEEHPTKGSTVTVWLQKYSFIEGYEPNISDPDNPQPNGFPDPNWEPSAP